MNAIDFSEKCDGDRSFPLVVRILLEQRFRLLPAPPCGKRKREPPTNLAAQGGGWSATRIGMP
jgi:hypothetical protein